jgi:hypothetical protein
LVVIGLHLPVVLVGQQVLLQQTLEASDMPADLLDLILQMEMCKVLIQPVMQLLPEAQGVTVGLLETVARAAPVLLV